MNMSFTAEWIGTMIGLFILVMGARWGIRFVGLFGRLLIGIWRGRKYNH